MQKTSPRPELEELECENLQIIKFGDIVFAGKWKNCLIILHKEDYSLPYFIFIFAEFGICSNALNSAPINELNSSNFHF